MAIQIINPVNNLTSHMKFSNLSFRTKQTFTDLVGANVHNRIVNMKIFDETFLNKFSFFDKGTFTKAIGGGIRYIMPKGINRVLRHEPPKAGTSVSLKIPYPIEEAEEIVGTIDRFKCSVNMPDILEAHNVFTSLRTLNQFLAMKIGDAVRSIRIHIAAYLEYALSIDPWGGDNANYVTSFGPAHLLSLSLNDNNELGTVIKQLKEKFKKEIEDKEKGVKNIYTYDTLEWSPYILSDIQKNAIKRYKKPTSKLSEAELKKLNKSNKDIDPLHSVIGLCRCISEHVEAMTEFTFENDPKFPGNDFDKITDYAKDAQNSGFLCAANPADIIIIMNNGLKKIIKSFAGISPQNPDGTFSSVIDKVASMNIIGLDTIPYGCIKIVDKNRYSMYNIYDLVGNDTLFQELANVYTAHKAFMLAVRETGVPMRVLCFSNLYLSPVAMSKVIKGEEKQEQLK